MLHSNIIENNVKIITRKPIKTSTSSSLYNYQNEIIQDVIKDVDCIQETKEHRAVIEYNWVIDDIISKINEKSSGEKIESEEFYYKKPTNDNSKSVFKDSVLTHDNEIMFCQYCKSNANKASKYDSKPLSLYASNENLCLHCVNLIKENNDKRIKALVASGSSPFLVYSQLFCDYFLTNSKWLIEIGHYENKSKPDDDDYISIYTHLIQTVDFNKFIETVADSSDEYLSLNYEISLKLNIFLFNAVLDEIFERKTYEIDLNLHQLNKNDKFGIPMFCKVESLIKWLLNKKSKDFCLILEYKFYQNDQHVNNTNESKLGSTKQKSLVKCFKHAWTIRNWRSFLNSNKILSYLDDNSQTDKLTNNCENNQNFNFYSKVFTLKSTYDSNDDEVASNRHQLNNTKIDNLLKQIKWKLQLYPRGYSQEYSQYVSLFLNFSEIGADLKKYAKENCINIASLNSPNNTITNDRNDEVDIILLLKPEMANDLSNTITLYGNGPFSTDIYKSKYCETLVKACFQISIIDEDGKKLDTCQSEKQLFELYGSWGYKEYLPIKDLFEMRDKYISNKFRLNCVIVLYYTVTVKSYLSFSKEVMKRIFNSSQADLIATLPSRSTFAIIESKNAYMNELLIHRDTEDEYERSKIDISTFTSSLISDLSRLYKQSDMYDLIIQAPYELDESELMGIETKLETLTKRFKNFKVHKLILSMRSIVFSRMFSENFNKRPENYANHVEIVKIIDFDAYTVDLFLKYLYTDKLEINYEDILNEEEDLSELDASICNNKDYDSNNSRVYVNLLIELFKISDKYCVNKLKQLCETKLISLINNGNLVQLLILSDLHNSYKLKQNCFDYLTDNLSNIIAQDNWLIVEKNYPNLIAEAFRILCLKKS